MSLVCFTNQEDVEYQENLFEDCWYFIHPEDFLPYSQVLKSISLLKQDYNNLNKVQVRYGEQIGWDGRKYNMEINIDNSQVMRDSRRT